MHVTLSVLAAAFPAVTAHAERARDKMEHLSRQARTALNQLGRRGGQAVRFGSLIRLDRRELPDAIGHDPHLISGTA